MYIATLNRLSVCTAHVHVDIDRREPSIERKYGSQKDLGKENVPTK